ncbi:type II secretion system F family protein [Thermosipho ferrireducens]|uniref:Type II secretion system F family protein n=1 Tax=Thermosipho ferrireducens TaxID=2571116 RepID=A0ABX7S765_9BACT|nr:type II secretion system F family protein [Thermosipho ferrireducens]QTA37630.1 type II secretion system F family protein [Thermosipho ferrireducens]
MNYKYVAYNRKGKKVSGTIEAQNVRDAINQLRNNGFAILEISKASETRFEFLKNLFTIPLKDIVLFSRQLETMISAGVRIKEALEVLSQQEIFSKRFRKVLTQVTIDLESGSSFSEALEKQNVFDEVLINMIKAGEEGGVLEDTLKKLSNYYESVNRMKQQVKSAMVYPTFILSFAIVVIIVISVFILPRLFSVFGNALQVGGLISILTKLNHLFLTSWPLISILGVLAIVGFALFLKTKYGQSFKNFLGNLIPPVRKLKEKITQERFCRTFGVLIGSGVSVIDTLEMAAKASNNPSFIKKIKNVQEKVRNGSTLKMALKEEKVFPQIIYEMVGTGEETGKLDTIMNKVADFFEEQITQDTKKLLSMIEPLMIAFVGLFIALLAYTMYTAIFQMQSSFGG